MFRFFRVIRKKYFRQKKIRKYLAYAGGEIFLVVLGILIALQINNWNESRKQNLKIITGLQELKANLEVDNSLINTVKSQIVKDLDLQDKIIKTLEDKKLLDSSFTEHLGRIMLMRRAKFVENGYNMLKSIGLEQIKNIELRNLIVFHYDTTVFQLLKDIDDDEDEFKNLLLPFIRKNFTDWKFGEIGIPRNYNTLTNDLEFKIMLKVNYLNKSSTLDRLNMAEKEIYQLIKLIDNYTENN